MLRWRPLLVLLSLATAMLAACSSNDATEVADDATPTTAAASSAPSGDATEANEPLAPFDGGDFYAVPEPLPDGDHGTLIRYEPMQDYELPGATTYRIMYRSESIAGDPIAVTGVASVPDTDAPADGRPMITISHGTTGIADECAPSLDPQRSELTLVGTELADEFLLAYTDYEGLGTPGRHPYLVGESEARSTLDAIVAAGQLPGADPGTRVAMAGYSQGGHGSLWSAQLAAEWTPDLEVVGTFAGAPASEVDLILAAAPRLPIAGFAYMIIAGLAAAHPEADLSILLTEAGLERLDEVDEGCAGEVIGGFAGTPASELIRPEGPSSEPWRSLARANNAGTEKTHDAPTLIIHSEQDELVPPIFSRALQNRMCANGEVVERRMLAEGGHGGAAIPAYEQAVRWLADRFDPDAPDPVSTCAP